MIEAAAYVSFMQALGIDPGRIIEDLFILMTAFISLMFVSCRYIWPIVKKFAFTFDELEKSVSKLNATLQEHIIQTDLRMDAGEEKFSEIGTEIKKIKVHIGLDK